MTKETHSTGGVCISLIMLNTILSLFLFPYDIAYKILLIALFFHFSYIGSLFPDIDQRKSSISQMYPFLSKHIGSKCRHRGFTHSLLCLSLIVLTLYIILNVSNFNIILLIISIGFIAGYISHLTLDFLTSEGIELFYPWKIKTGSKTEKIINKILKIFNFLLIIYNIVLILSDILGINILSFISKSTLF